MWKEGKRRKDCFDFSDWCVLDFDDGSRCLSQAIEIFSGFCHVIGTTKNHQKEKNGKVCDRYRVAIPWQKRITSVDDYLHNMKRLQQSYGSDKQAIGAHMKFRPCVTIASVKGEGNHIFVEKSPPKPKKDGPKYSSDSMGIIPEWIRETVTRGVPEGQRNVTCLKIARHMGWYGFSLRETTDLLLRYKIGESDEEIRKTASSGWQFSKQNSKI